MQRLCPLGRLGRVRLVLGLFVVGALEDREQAGDLAEVARCLVTASLAIAVSAR